MEFCIGAEQRIAWHGMAREGSLALLSILVEGEERLFGIEFRGLD